MTAEELIAELQKHPPHAAIRVTGDSTIATKVEAGTCHGCYQPEVQIR